MKEEGKGKNGKRIIIKREMKGMNWKIVQCVYIRQRALLIGCYADLSQHNEYRHPKPVL
jgi:hypothetical protein